jgi:hypothetical protein
MTTFPGSPPLTKAGLVLLDATTGAVQRIITLQYNPETVTRSLQVQGPSAEGGDTSEALRLKGPPIETIKLEAEIDATDQLGQSTPDPTAVSSGIYPQLAVLETIAYPTSADLQAANLLAAAGTIEILPALGPLTLFVWSKYRVMAVRLTEVTIVEEAFDPTLNPIRAKVSLTMRVLSVNDLGFGSKGGSIFMAYLQQKESLAALSKQGTFADLNIGGIP